MFCPNCGHENDNTAKFCYNCGQNLEELRAAATPAQGEPEPPVEVPAPSEPLVPEPAVVPVEQPTAVAPQVPAPEVEATQVQPRPVEQTSAQPIVPPSSPVSDPTPQPFTQPAEPAGAPVPQPTVPTAPPVPPEFVAQGAPVPEAPQPVPAGPAQAAPTPPGASPEGATKPAWYASTAGRIVMGLAGIALMVSGIVRIVQSTGCSRQESKPGVSIVQGADDSGSDASSGGAGFASKTDTGSSSDSSGGSGFAPKTDTDSSSASGFTPKTDTDSSSDSTSASGSGSTGTASGAKDYAQGRDTSFLSNTDLTDAYGQPTFYAVMELEGWQLATLAQEQGYAWTEADSESFWIDEAQTCAWNYLRQGAFFSDEELAKLPKGAQGFPAVFFGIMGGYESEQDAARGLAKCMINSSAKGHDGDYVYVVNGPSMIEYLVDIKDAEDGDYQITIYGPDAISAGYYDSMHELPNGVASFGSTVREAFEAYTGAAYGDQLPAE